MTLPNFLYLGPDKAGSTWIHETLIRHPDIYLTPAKDLYFFDRYFDRGVDWYAKFFVDGEGAEVVGEICQDYLADPRAPERIGDVLGKPRVMVSLRDPAERAFSSYLYMRKHGEGPDTFGEALQTRPELLEHGRYGSQLRRYQAVLSREKIHVGVFDDLRDSSQEFLDEILRWLELSPYTLSADEAESKLPASRARVTAIAWIARRAAAAVRTFDGAELVGRIKRSPGVHRLLYKPLEPAERQIPETDRDWIRDQLRDEVRMVDSDFGTDLEKRWGWS